MDIICSLALAMPGSVAARGEPQPSSISIREASVDDLVDRLMGAGASADTLRASAIAVDASGVGCGGAVVVAVGEGRLQRGKK